MSNEQAELVVRILCQRHRMSIEQLSNYILYDLCRSLSKDMSDKLCALFNAAQRMIEAGAL